MPLTTPASNDSAVTTWISFVGPVRMGITVVPVSMSDFRVLASLEICTMAYFEASWTNKRRAYYSRKSILNSLADFDGVLPVLFHITVYGSDDAEDFVINRLASTALPALAIFSVGLRTEFTGAIDSGGALNDPYFHSNLRRVIELYPKTLIESPTDRNEKSDTILTEESTFNSGNFDEASRLNLETVMSLVFDPSEKSSTTDDLCVSNGKECSKIGGYSSSNSMQQNSSEAMTGVSDSEALILFVAGDKSSVGKSSICLAILASLVRLGADPSLIAYIKVSINSD